MPPDFISLPPPSISKLDSDTINAKSFLVSGGLLLILFFMIVLLFLKSRSKFSPENKMIWDQQCYSCAEVLQREWMGLGDERRGGICVTCDRFTCPACLGFKLVKTRHVLKKHQEGETSNEKMYNICQSCVNRGAHRGEW
eukprot:TRINITY_DN3252_c0_g1_i2.p1 TRINITY_DN3252_c0_g1~~TRINITY_DN3252_c0_g1_i2.p1  ORF type:complete len:140 (+),score=4.93 TRINITY_DN3252_c0_g1_i2:233-652(+)